MELRHEMVQAVDGQHRLVGARGGVEGDLLLHRLPVSLELFGRVAQHHHGRGADGEVARRAPGRPPALGHGGVNDLAEILRAVKGMDVDAVAELAGQTAHVRVDGREIDGNPRVLDRPRVEEGGHQVEAIRGAPEVERRAVLPALPDGPQGEHDLAQSRSRWLPADGETPLVVRLDLGAEAEGEPTPGGLLEVPGRVGQHHGAARERNGDGGAELQALGVHRRHREGQEGVVPRLGGPEAAEAHGLRAARLVGDRAEVDGVDAEIEPQAHRLLNTCRSRSRSPSP